MDSLRDELLASIELRATGKTGAPSGFQPASPTISWAKEKDIWLTMYTNATNARTAPPSGFQPASATISWAKEKDIWLTMYTNAMNSQSTPPDGQTLMASSALSPVAFDSVRDTVTSKVQERAAKNVADPDTPYMESPGVGKAF